MSYITHELFLNDLSSRFKNCLWGTARIIASNLFFGGSFNTSNPYSFLNSVESTKGSYIVGKALNDKRGLEGDVEKYKPDTFYVNSPERWNTTVGAFTKETKRPCVIVKDTNRKKSRSFFGPAVSDYEKHKLKPKFKVKPI